MPLTVALIGVPSALGAPDPGPDLGPQAIRAAGLVERLERLRVDVQDFGDVAVDDVQGSGGIPALRGTDVLAEIGRAHV